MPVTDKRVRGRIALPELCWAARRDADLMSFSRYAPPLLPSASCVRRNCSGSLSFKIQPEP